MFTYGSKLEAVVINTNSLKEHDDPSFVQECHIGSLDIRKAYIWRNMTFGNIQQHDLN